MCMHYSCCMTFSITGSFLGLKLAILVGLTRLANALFGCASLCFTPPPPRLGLQAYRIIADFIWVLTI